MCPSQDPACQMSIQWCSCCQFTFTFHLHEHFLHSTFFLFIQSMISVIFVFCSFLGATQLVGNCFTGCHFLCHAEIITISIKLWIKMALNQLHHINTANKSFGSRWHDYIVDPIHSELHYSGNMMSLWRRLKGVYKHSVLHAAACSAHVWFPL